MDERPKSGVSTKGRPGAATPPKEKTAAPARRDGPRGPKLNAKTIRIAVAGLIVVVILVALAIDALGGDDSSSRGGPPRTGENAVALSESALLARAKSFEHPVYWVGGRVGTDSYELDTAENGNVYVRYLTGGAKAGDPRADFLTIGTYPVSDARRALEKGAKTAREGQKLSRQEGFEVLSSPGSNNAYVVFEEQPELQIEIYSPQPGEAAELATSGALIPLG